MKRWVLISDWAIGGSILLTLLWDGICSLFAPGWIAACMIAVIDWFIFIVYAIKYKDSLVFRLMIFAVVAGWVELLADRWLIVITETLVYQPGGPFVVSSPLYMPFTWGVVLVQTAYVGWRILKSFGLVRAILVTSSLGAITIPLYECWAKGAMWWYYQNSRMWGVVPFYIIVGEFFVVGALVLLVRMFEGRPWWFAPIFGLVQGLWIWLCYIFAFTLVG
ncbi:MAG: hypothetical protein ACE5GU_02650 [Candidatus Scalinduaceae bacterium]